MAPQEMMVMPGRDCDAENVAGNAGHAQVSRLPRLGTLRRALRGIWHLSWHCLFRHRKSMSD